ncbi:hypothetical protein LTR84_000271 [Exophiala bonariae]|uniref:Transcription factor domain-containing protein n=1 Tax=Exophiala bonariae TaxID=1690606 RepID=A0AAV9NQG2_9EURO|nr:hypothetical protein LTR84_000271 [Exophiala bonariae]
MVRDGHQSQTGIAGHISPSTAELILDDGLMLDLTFQLFDREISTPTSLVQASNVPTMKADWFLAPETWKISHGVEPSSALPVGKTTMKNYMKILQSWFERWVTTGSSPLFHHCLYSTNSPACVQVAYATLSSYIYRTSANTETILQIVEDRSNDLLRDNGATLDRVGDDKWADEEHQDVELFVQLTRLHALLVYQIIGLLESDLRSRHVAEGRLAVQTSWARKLFQSAGTVLSNAHSVDTQLVGFLSIASNYSQQQWYLWILSESIRRVWLVAVSLSSIFSALQRGWGTCPGGIMYTHRSGLWNAASATEWEKHCSGKQVEFLHRFGSTKLFDDAEPADVDEFGTAMLDMTFNGELLERWRGGSVRSN